MIRKNKKAFDPELCEQSDLPAKQVAVEVLSRITKLRLVVPLEYQVERFKDWDFVMADQAGNEIPIEVERSYAWDTYYFFPWDEAHLVGRKLESKAKVLLVTNKHLNMCWVIPMARVMKCPLDVRSTTYTTNELMRIIPAKWLQIYGRDENGEWGLVQKADWSE